MNKINHTDDLKLDAEVNQAAVDHKTIAEEADPGMDQETETTDTQPEQDKLNLSAKDQVAMRGDLIELHKRMVDMFKTLSTGLAALSTEKAEKDRATLSARIDEMERSLNTMEGMVRIEMVPQFRSVLNDALEERDIGSSSRLGSRILTTLLVVAALAAGVVWSAEIATFSAGLIESGRNLLTPN